MIDEFFAAAHLGATAKPLDVENCLNHMVNFVKKEKLDCIIGNGLSNEELIRKLHPQAEIVSQLPIKLRCLSSELALPLSIMSLYDLVVLAGECISRGHFHILTLTQF